MRILAIDTATEACSVALDDNGTVYSRFDVSPQQQSQLVLPMVDAVLKEANLTLSDVDLLAYGRGPGSFTGVRIATGIIQGLALGSDLPVAGISTLAAMAQQSFEEHNQTRVVSAIDARMSEVYVAAFEEKAGIMVSIQDEQVCPPEHAKTHVIPAEDFAAVGTGWQAYEVLSEQIVDDANTVSVLYPNAKYMLALALDAYKNNKTTSVDDVEPVYLRDKVTWKKLPGRE